MNATFNNLINEVKKEYAEREASRIKHLATYENALRNELTETRWNQLQTGKITKDQAIEYATKRIKKDIEKKLEKTLAHIAEVAEAPELTYISVNTYYTSYGTAYAEVRTNYTTTHGKATGWGYDKESSATAECFNNDIAILKVLYTLKENALAQGKTDKSATACTGRDNRDIIGYGAGYTALPYFEGGVGVGCFWNILKKAGYKTTVNYGKKETFYHIEKDNENVA